MDQGTERIWVDRKRDLAYFKNSCIQTITKPRERQSPFLKFRGSLNKRILMQVNTITPTPKPISLEGQI